MKNNNKGKKVDINNEVFDKILLDENKILNDYELYKNLSEDAEKEKRILKFKIGLMFIAGWIIGSLLFVVFITGNGNIQFPTRNNDEQKIIQKIELLEKKIEITNNSYSKIEEMLIKDSENVEVKTIISKIDLIEERQNEIEETVLFDVEKALTTRLLKDKQEVISEDFKELKKSVAQLNNRMFDIIITIIIVPLIAFILNFFGKPFIEKKLKK